MASGGVPLISDACTDICKHMENAMVHRVGDVDALAHHLTMLHTDRRLLEQLRAAGLRAVPGITWAAAGTRLVEVYRETIEMFAANASRIDDSPSADARRRGASVW